MSGAVWYHLLELFCESLIMTRLLIMQEITYLELTWQLGKLSVFSSLQLLPILYAEITLFQRSSWQSMNDSRQPTYGYSAVQSFPLPSDHEKQETISEAINLPPVAAVTHSLPYQVGSWRYKRRWPLPRNSSNRADRGGWAGRHTQQSRPPTPSDIGHTCL